MSTVANENAIGTKAVVMGCACVIFSSLTPDEIKRFKTFHPEALNAVDDEGDTSFSIDIDDGPGQITSEGATFSRVTSANGKATITILIDPEIDDPMNTVKERIGGPLMSLIEIEEQLTEMLPKLDEEEKAISQQITRL